MGTVEHDGMPTTEGSMEIAAVMWRNDHDRSTEVCRLVESSDGFAFEGTVLIPVYEHPETVDYRVDVDPEWITRRVRLVQRSSGATRELSLERDWDGRWTRDGQHQPRLDGCVDVDLRLTAATNTLPIRRLAPAVGEAVDVQAAWVGFPGLELKVSRQTYERLSETRYRFRSSDFVADLEVEDAGMVLQYGEGFWRVVAHSGRPT
jgi:hypothetical protein